MATYLETVGIAEATRGLPVVHVAGTKGKGSTCVFVESVLRASGRTAALFTSPHLVDVRERLRLGGRLIAKTQWTRAFWEVRACALGVRQATGSAGRHACVRRARWAAVAVRGPASANERDH